MIAKKDIEQVRENIDLVELVKDCDVELSHSGRQFKGLCPFPSHDERTPSFTVNPETNRYICYGCGVNGDAIDFLREVQGMTFTESVEFLAKRLGMTIQITEGDAEKKKSDAPLAEINAAARDWFAAQPNDEVSKFFQSRNLDEDYLRKEWGVGYSAPGGLLPHLKSLGFSENHIVEAGLARRSEKGNQVYESFKGRLMWTIYDHLNRPAGFGARKIYENDPMPGKFVNTVATELYKKSDVLFGLDKARQGIRKDSIAIISEGYTDVVVFHLAGLPYAVASCGTAVTENHVRRLARLLGENGELVVAMDGDAAGVGAAVKLLDMATTYPIRLSCILFPDKMDPEEYRRAHGEQGLHALFDNRQPLVETLLVHTLKQYDLTNPEGVSQATTEAGKVLGSVHNAVLREQYERWLAMRLKVSPTNVSSSYEERKVRKNRRIETNANIEFDVLRMAYQKPTIFKEYIDTICRSPEMFNQEQVQNAIEEILWLDTEVDDAEWRETLTFSFPELEAQMKVGLPFKVIESDRIASQFMNELVTRLDGDMRARHAQSQIRSDIFEGVDDPAQIFKKLAEKSGVKA